MKEKIETAKMSIIDRIQKNLNDENKSLTAETLVAFAKIVEMFDKPEIVSTKSNIEVKEVETL